MIRACLALLGLVGSAGSVAWEARFQDAASRLAPNATSVTSCWDPNGTTLYRAVVFTQGYEHVSSEVYLQWLETSQDGPRLVKSVLVEPLSSGFWSVGEPVVLSRQNCSMQLQATHTFSSETARFVLKPAGQGNYPLRRVAKK